MDRFGEDAAQVFLDKVQWGGPEVVAWSDPWDKNAAAALLGEAVVNASFFEEPVDMVRANFDVSAVLPLPGRNTGE